MPGRYIYYQSEQSTPEINHSINNFVMKKAIVLMLFFVALVSFTSKASDQISVTFSTDFTDTDISLIVEDNQMNSLVTLIEQKGIYLVYEPSETWSGGIKVPLTRVDESLTYSSGSIMLDRNVVYEYYFEIGSDGYFAESSFDNIARLAPGYYRFLYTNTSDDTWVLDPITFNGTAPSGKKLLRVKVDMTGNTVSDNGVFAVSGTSIVPLVNTNKIINSSDTQNIYEGLMYADEGTDLTYTFYNGTVPEDMLIDNNTYTAQLTEDIEKDAVEFSTDNPYEAVNYDLYNPAYIQRIEIKFEEDNWAEILADYKDNNLDMYLQSVWVKINGVALEGAGVKFKGNSSYHSSYTKNPFNISLDEFVDDNKYQEYTTLKLANVFGDPSFVREVLSYEILNNYMESGKTNFAQVYVNGEYLGLYSNTESVNKSFCTRHFGSKNNTFVECSPVSSPSVSTKSNLQYISDDEADYEASYELKVGAWESFIALCNTVTNNPSDMEEILDVDKFLWYLAFNNIVVNIDSYVGVYSQNYYLYQSSEGRFMVIPWDLNLSFGGFNNLGNSNRLYTLDLTQRQQLELDAHSTDTYWPVIKAVYENDTWRKMYLTHCKTIYEEYIENGAYLESAKTWMALAEQSVGADKNKFYSLDKFHSALTEDYALNGYAINGIETLMEARKTYLSTLAEFTYTQPSLSDQSVNELTFTVSADNSDMVYLYYRLKGDGNGAFTAIEMANTGGIYSVTLPDASNAILEYYFYAENTNIGAFLPARAAHEFYTYDNSDDDDVDLSNYWIKDDFSTYTVESDYITSVTNRSTIPNDIELATYYTNIELQSGTCGSGNGLRIRGLGDDGYAEFTVPNTNSTTIFVKAKSSSADRAINIYRNGILDETISGLDENNCAEYIDSEKSSEPVTYKITGGKENDTKPVIIKSITVEKYGSSSIINNMASSTLRIYPNPVQNTLNIVLPDGAKATSAKIYTMTGQLILSESFSGVTSFSLSVDYLPKGLYNIQISTDKQQISSKIIKQ